MRGCAGQYPVRSTFFRRHRRLRLDLLQKVTAKIFDEINGTCTPGQVKESYLSEPSRLRRQKPESAISGANESFWQLGRRRHGAVGTKPRGCCRSDCHPPFG